MKMKTALIRMPLLRKLKGDSWHYNLSFLRCSKLMLCVHACVVGVCVFVFWGKKVRDLRLTRLLTQINNQR